MSKQEAQAPPAPPPLADRERTTVLIPEARRRQRRRRQFTIGMLFAVAVVGLVVARVAATGGPPGQTVAPGASGSVAAGRFAGTWHVHTWYVMIGADGHGSAKWPIGTPRGISDGGRARIRLTSVSGTRAEGVISGSTEPSVLPDGPATMRVTSDDLLYVTPAGPTTSSPFGRSGFCGPKAAALSIAQQQAAHINCGA